MSDAKIPVIKSRLLFYADNNIPLTTQHKFFSLKKQHKNLSQTKTSLTDDLNILKGYFGTKKLEPNPNRQK